MNHSECVHCFKPLLITRTIGRPDLDQWRCENPDCERFGFDQAPRFRGKHSAQQTWSDDNVIEVFQLGRGVASECEGNVNRVCISIASAGGSKCEPKPKHEAQNGADAYLYEPDRTCRHVQVTEAVNRKWIERAMREKERGLRGRFTFEQLVGQISDALHAKTEKWTKTWGDPKQTILAIDISTFGLFAYLAFRYDRELWTKLQEQASNTGWFDVLIVDGHNCWSLKAA
jgi:hypothetical protein